MGTCSRSRLQTPHKTSYRQSVTRVHVWRCGPEGGHQVRPPNDRTTLLQCATSGATAHCVNTDFVITTFYVPVPERKQAKTHANCVAHCTGLVVQALDLQSNASKPPFPCGMPSSPNLHLLIHLARTCDSTCAVPAGLNTVVSSMVEI